MDLSTMKGQRAMNQGLCRLRLAILLTLLGITSSPATQAKDAFVPTAQQMTSEYEYIKRDVQVRYDHLRSKGRSFSPEILPQQVIVFDCGIQPGLDFNTMGAMIRVEPGTPNWSLQLFKIAKGAVQLEYVATKFKYPESYWKPQLQEYERTGIAHARMLGNKTYTDNTILLNDLIGYPGEIVESLERLRKKNRLPLPRLQEVDGCGAGDYPVEIKTTPPTATVRIIPEFFALLCERTDRPLTGDFCPYWREVSTSSGYTVSGNYRFRALWPDATVRSGKVDFDKIPQKDGIPLFEIKR